MKNKGKLAWKGSVLKTACCFLVFFLNNGMSGAGREGGREGGGELLTRSISLTIIVAQRL